MRRWLAVSIVFTLVSGQLFASEKVLLFRFRAVGIDEELVDAVTLIFQGALEEEGRYAPVSAYDVIADYDCYDLYCAVPLAREAGLRMAVTGSLTRLGGKIIVRVNLIDAEREETVFSSDGVAQTEEDLDVVLDRLAKGLASGREMESTAEVGLITEHEYDEVRRRESFYSKSFRAGLMWPTSGSMGGVDRLIAIDFAGQYDTPDFFLSGRSGVRWGGDIDEDGGSALDIALLEARIGKYANRGDFTTFMSAGLGLHWVRARERIDDAAGEREDSEIGLALIAGGGFTAFRTYNFQFQIDCDYFFFLEKLDVGGYPQGILFTFCIKGGRRND